MILRTRLKLSAKFRFNYRPALLTRVLAKDEQSWSDFYPIYTPLICWRCHKQGIHDEYRPQLVV